ncbi:DUF317 domain-containing protein [Streptomyces zagrosensis]|uniref:DUF317 domain-containing protein n=1 Tax=Streptomyces zagrosensis TaxID=1042984 RepID=A0A7W9QCP1_9ACTN|nr:DUF317 domain-containing protein [Streptomyces zagrosensis]MBB5937669.1 hypothetical protein [Streptomyces zagrosensis]
MLEQFLAENSSWEKHYQWPGEATYALHESLVLRVELYHHPGAGPRDELWTVAAYESPVGDRLWHATATAGTPEGIIMTLLKSLGDEHDWGSTTWTASTAPPDQGRPVPRRLPSQAQSGLTRRRVPPPARPTRDLDGLVAPAVRPPSTGSHAPRP